MENKDNIEGEQEESLEELRLRLRRKWANLIHHPNASAETKEILSKTLEEFIN